MFFLTEDPHKWYGFMEGPMMEARALTPLISLSFLHFFLSLLITIITPASPPVASASSVA